MREFVTSKNQGTYFILHTPTNFRSICLIPHMVLCMHCRHLLPLVLEFLNATLFHFHTLRCKVPMIPSNPTDSPLVLYWVK